MLVGEFTPDGTFLLNLIGTIGFLALAVGKVWDLVGRKEAQKREVSFQTEWARKSEVERIERDVEKLEGKLDESVEGIRREMKEDREIRLRAGEDRASKIHARIDLVLGEVKRLGGRVDRERD